MSTEKKKNPYKKQLEKLLRVSGSYKYSDLTSLLGKLGYKKSEKEGSRVAFYNADLDNLIRIHNPHPENTVKKYAQRIVIKHLTDNGEFKMKNNLLQYKGYYGTIDSDLEDECLMGKILHINDLITYEAETIPALKKEFEIAVNDYLDLCKEFGRKPQKPFNGSFNVRISPERHKQLAIKSTKENCSINEIVKKAIIHCLDTEPLPTNIK